MYWLIGLRCSSKVLINMYRFQGCALAEPGGPWRLTFVLGWLENLCFFIEIICWAHWISQVQSPGLPLIFLRAQPWVLIRKRLILVINKPVAD